MNIHKNAKLTPKSREILVERMQFFPVAQVAREMGVSTRTAYKWKNRYHQGGVAALMDASSRPHNCRNKLNKHQIEDICALRKERQTGYAIAQNLMLSVSIVYRTLKNHGLSNLKRLEAKAPVKRYEWPNPGDMRHMDIKKLGKIDGPGHWP